MSYKNKTYVAFDGDKDIWAYRFMKGWNANEHMDFEFHDAHAIKELSERAQDETYIKKILRERLQNSKQLILIVGESTKFLRKYVQWEIESAIAVDIPIIVCNLNGLNGLDNSLCPTSLSNHLAIHGPFKKEFITLSMDDFSVRYKEYKKEYNGPIHYTKFNHNY